jgi:hypothetical protein
VVGVDGDDLTEEFDVIGGGTIFVLFHSGTLGRADLTDETDERLYGLLGWRMNLVFPSGVILPYVLGTYPRR